MHSEKYDYDYLFIPSPVSDQVIHVNFSNYCPDRVDNEYFSGWEYSHTEEFQGVYCLVYKKKVV